MLKLEEHCHRQSSSLPLRIVCVLSAGSDLCVSQTSGFRKAHLSPPCLKHNTHDSWSQEGMMLWEELAA